ncbi:MAG TPA: FHA domain-containing protein [Myxococcales bacterium]
MAKAKKRAVRKAAPRKTARKVAPRKAAGSGGGEREMLVRRIAQALGITVAEALLRALRELAERVAPQKPSRPDPAHAQAEKLQAKATRVRPGALPERLYLLLDGRGLDGRGMPVEVIDVPTVVGSERHCTVWVNSPQIETRHLQFARDEGEWYVEDLGSTHGTFLGDQRITRRRVEDGDEYRLAGYLRLRTELR